MPSELEKLISWKDITENSSLLTAHSALNMKTMNEKRKFMGMEMIPSAYLPADKMVIITLPGGTQAVAVGKQSPEVALDSPLGTELQ